MLSPVPNHPWLAKTAQANAEELLERARTAGERAADRRIESEGSTAPLIAEDAESLGGNLPAEDIAATEERRQ